MKCSDFKEQISIYIDQMLDADSKKEFEKHKSICTDCREELEEIAEMVRLCSSIPQEEIPDNFKHDLHLKLAREKRIQWHSIWPVRLKNKYMKVGSAIAASLLLVFMMRGFVSDYMPFGNGRTSDLSESYSYDAAKKSAASQSETADPQRKSGAQDSSTGDGINQQIDASQFAGGSEFASINGNLDTDSGTANTDGSATIAADDANADIAWSDRRIQGQDTKGTVNDYKESTRGYASPAPSQDSGPTPGIPEVNMEDSDPALLGLQSNEEVSFKRYNAARLCNVSNITIKAASPRLEAEKIKKYLVAFGAQIIDMNDEQSTPTCGEAEQRLKIQQNRAIGGETLVARIPQSSYEKLAFSLQSSFVPSRIAIEPVRVIDMSARAKELENTIIKLDVLLTNTLNSKDSLSKQKIDPIKQQKLEAGLELQQISQGFNNVFVLITIVVN